MKSDDVEALAVASFALSATLMRSLTARGVLTRADAAGIVESALGQVRALYGYPEPATAGADGIDIDAFLDAAHEHDAEAVLRKLLQGLGAAGAQPAGTIFGRRD